MSENSRKNLSFYFVIFLSFLLVASHFFLPKHEIPDSLVLQIINLVVAIIGLLFLWRCLLSIFPEATTALLMTLVVLGTNYFQVITGNSPSPVNYLFTCYALILWFTIKWHEKQEWLSACLLGVMLGLTILISPADFAVILIPFFWNVMDRNSFIEKMKFFKKHIQQVALSFLLMIMLLAPLFFAWNFFMNEFHYFGYSGKGLVYLLARYFWQVLFSFKNGWLIYTPLMIFLVAGFYMLGEKNKKIYYPVFFLFLVNFFYFSSWSSFHSHVNLGFQALVPTYVILSIPIGYLLSYILDRGIFSKIFAGLVFGFFVILNLLQTWQYEKGILIPDVMNAGYYSALFGRTSVPVMEMIKIDYSRVNPDILLTEEREFKKSELLTYDFENRSADYSHHLEGEIVKNGKNALQLDSTFQFSPALDKHYGEIMNKKFIGLRLSAWIYSRMPFRGNKTHIVFTSEHLKKNYRYRAIGLDTLHLVPGKWNQIVMNYLLPIDPEPDDRILGYIYYTGKDRIYVDDLKFELFEQKK